MPSLRPSGELNSANWWRTLDSDRITGRIWMFWMSFVPDCVYGCKGVYARVRLCKGLDSNCRVTVAHVDSSDFRGRCVGKIIARDLRLVASRLYKKGVTRPWTRHVQPCHYIIPLCRCRPPGLHNPVQE